MKHRLLRNYFLEWQKNETVPKRFQLYYKMKARKTTLKKQTICAAKT